MDEPRLARLSMRAILLISGPQKSKLDQWSKRDKDSTTAPKFTLQLNGQAFLYRLNFTPCMMFPFLINPCQSSISHAMIVSWTSIHVTPFLSLRTSGLRIPCWFRIGFDKAEWCFEPLSKDLALILPWEVHNHPTVEPRHILAAQTYADAEIEARPTPTDKAKQSGGGGGYLKGRVIMSTFSLLRRMVVLELANQGKYTIWFASIVSLPHKMTKPDSAHSAVCSICVMVQSLNAEHHSRWHTITVTQLWSRRMKFVDGDCETMAVEVVASCSL